VIEGKDSVGEAVGVPDDAERLVRVLEELATVLADNGEPDWAGRVRTNVARTRRGDGSGVVDFLAAFGGMGSLNDVVFSPLNGNIASDPAAASVTSHFHALKGEAYDLAASLRRGGHVD